MLAGLTRFLYRKFDSCERQLEYICICERIHEQIVRDLLTFLSSTIVSFLDFSDILQTKGLFFPFLDHRYDVFYAHKQTAEIDNILLHLTYYSYRRSCDTAGYMI